jgi:hypothetical protein
VCTFQVASITKVMTFLVVHDGIASGVVGLGDHVPVTVTVGGTTADLKVRSAAQPELCRSVVEVVVVEGVGIVSSVCSMQALCNVAGDRTDDAMRARTYVVTSLLSRTRLGMYSPCKTCCTE